MTRHHPRLVRRPRHPGLRGFTLIEVIVVVAIIALLAAIIVPVVAGQINKAKLTSQAADLKEIGNAYNRLFIDTQMWPHWTNPLMWDPTSPTGSGGVVALGNAAPNTANALWTPPPSTGPYNAASWKGPYLNTNDRFFTSSATSGVPGVRDRWDRPYQINHIPTNPGATPPFWGSIIIYSLGPNGTVDPATTTAVTNLTSPGCPPASATNDDVCYVITVRVR